jgi:ankyrin repeat protein
MSSLDNLRKAAKRWLKELRAGEPTAAARLQAVLPQSFPSPGLRDIQRALALERGFESWSALKKKVANDELRGDGVSDEACLHALIEAASKGDVGRVIEIADASPEIISRRGELEGHNGFRTALHFGIKHEPVIRALLERGADPNVRDEGDNAMPLHFAAEDQNPRIIRLLVDHGADTIGTGDTHELEVIGWSCCWDYREANKEIVDYLLAHGAKHQIFSAVTMGEADVVRSLVAENRELLVRRMDRTNKRRTPLHQAVVKRQLQSVAVLIELGADLEALDAAGLTPLDQAALEDQHDIAQLLIDRGAVVRLPAAVALDRPDDIERLMRESPRDLEPGHRFGTLIVRAAAASSGATVAKLIQVGASVNVQDGESTSVDQTSGYTSLHAAAFHGNEAAVRVLLKHGADINAREEKYGSPPAGWADYAGHQHIRDMILRGPIDIFQAIDFDVIERIPQLLKTDRAALQRRYRGYTPLAWAACKNNVEAAKYLVEEGAQLDLTPDQEARVGNEDGFRIVQRLLEARDKRDRPPAAVSHSERVSTFVEFATWDHQVHRKGDHRMCDRAAQRLLAQDTKLARHNCSRRSCVGIWTR